jgi:hypothetical protein
LKSMHTCSAAAVFAAAFLVAPAFAAPAADDPPLCTADKESIRDLKRSYAGLEAQKENLKIKELGDVKEVNFGPVPKSVNQYANSTTYGTKSRWCQATAKLSNGKSDTVFWRMDYIHERNGHSINFEHCATNHDLLDPGCKTIRAGK